MIQESFCSTTWKAPRLDTAGEKTGNLESAEYVPSRNTAPSPLLMSVPGALIGHNKNEIARSMAATGVTTEKGVTKDNMAWSNRRLEFGSAGLPRRSPRPLSDSEKHDKAGEDRSQDEE